MPAGPGPDGRYLHHPGTDAGPSPNVVQRGRICQGQTCDGTLLQVATRQRQLQPLVWRVLPGDGRSRKGRKAPRDGRQEARHERPAPPGACLRPRLSLRRCRRGVQRLPLRPEAPAPPYGSGRAARHPDTQPPAHAQGSGACVRHRQLCGRPPQLPGSLQDGARKRHPEPLCRLLQGERTHGRHRLRDGAGQQALL